MVEAGEGIEFPAARGEVIRVRITTRCSGLSLKCMPRGRVMQLGKGACALNVRRSAAELGR